jgi:hypothetical protein
VNEPVSTTGVAERTPGVADTTPGVAGETPGVTETPTPTLDEYVNELEAELDAEIAGLDSNYSPGDHNESNTNDYLDDSFTPINHDKTADTDADATREQASADDNMPALSDGHNIKSDDEDEESNDKGNKQPLTRLRRNRIPSYGHL